MEAQKFLRRWIAPCLALFAASTLYSQSVMDLFSTLLCCFCVYWVFWVESPELKFFQLKGWKVFFPKTPLGWQFVAWWLIVLISLLLNDFQHAPTAKILINFKWILIWYVFVFVFDHVTLLPRAVFWSSMVVFTTTFYSLFFFFMKYDPGENIWYEKLAYMRSGGVFHNPMTYAHSFSMIFFVLAGALLGAAFAREREWNLEVSQMHEKTLPSSVFVYLKALAQSDHVQWKSRLSLGALILLFVSVFLTMTRGVWGGLIVGLLTMAFLIRPLLGWITLGGCAAVFTGLFLSWKPFATRLLHIFDYQKNYDMQRMTIWKANWNIFLDHPWFGIGYTENARRLAEYYLKMGVPEDKYFISHAHNQYLHMMAGTGVVGLVIFLSIIVTFLILNWRAWKSELNIFYKYLLLGGFCAQVCFHVGALTEANFEHSKVRFVLMLIWALAVSRYLSHQRRSA